MRRRSQSSIPRTVIPDGRNDIGGVRSSQDDRALACLLGLEALLLKVVAHHDGGGGTFPCRADHLLGAPRADIAGGEYAGDVGLKALAGRDEPPRIRVQRSLEGLAVGLQSNEHEHRARGRLLRLARFHVLEKDRP